MSVPVGPLLHLHLRRRGCGPRQPLQPTAGWGCGRRSLRLSRRSQLSSPSPLPGSCGQPTCWTSVRTLRAALCLAPRRGALRPPPSRAPPSKELPRPDGAISPAPRVGCASPCRAATLRSLPLPYMTDVLEPLGVSSATCPPQVRPRRGGAPGPSSTHGSILRKGQSLHLARSRCWRSVWAK